LFFVVLVEAAGFRSISAGFTKRLERFGPPIRRPKGRGQGRPRVQSRRRGRCQLVRDGLTATDGGNAEAIASAQNAWSVLGRRIGAPSPSRRLRSSRIHAS